MGQLNELQIKAAQPRDKEYLLADGEGLYLRVRPTGKAWVYRYKEARKEAKLSLGRYPAMSLAVARKKARSEAEKRADGVDPREARREEGERDRVARLNTFELMARAWHAQAKKDRQWSDSYAEKVMRHLELHIFPWLGSLTMETIKPTELVRCLHRIKERGNLETAQRVREAVQHVFQYAVDVGALEPAKNFVNCRTGGLPSPRARHYAAITDPQKLGQLLRDMQAYNGNIITRSSVPSLPILRSRSRSMHCVNALAPTKFRVTMAIPSAQLLAEPSVGSTIGSMRNERRRLPLRPGNLPWRKPSIHSAGSRGRSSVNLLPAWIRPHCSW